jgi:hypothetical protein
MVEVDYEGLARSARKLGGEGSNFVVFDPVGEVTEELLDDALPGQGEDAPNNGGWSHGPLGWILLVEGLDEEVHPWLEELAARLAAAGVQGRLSGAKVSSRPRWALEVERAGGRLYARLGFAPVPGTNIRNRWVGGERTLEQASRFGASWASEGGRPLLGSTGEGASLWTSPQVAAHLLSSTASSHRAIATGYDQEHGEIRVASIAAHNGLGLSIQRRGRPWREMVDDLAAAVQAAPADALTVAQISHRDWGTVLHAELPGNEDCDPDAYDWHPEIWDRFVPEPAGLSILTERHLDAAHDLSDWRTTRLDSGHYRVEARDLSPWYEPPLRPGDPVNADVWRAARHAFGDMVLTTAQAKTMGLTTYLS